MKLFLFIMYVYILLIQILHIFYIIIGEAIEKMLQEKRISSKINYEVLKSLNVGIGSNTQSQQRSDDISFVSPKKIEKSEISSVTLAS
jgi:hypothetical protein